MVSNLRPAERLLLDLGVAEPSDIDIEAIAHVQGLQILYRPLDGCDALIMGAGDRGIITVNSHAAPQRKRFSIAHELGHWQFHRKRTTLCSAKDIERGNQNKNRMLDDERVADRFGSELLMPTYLLKPAVGKIRYLDWALVSRIARAFDTSIPATAIRLVEANLVPSLLVCHRPAGRAWFVRAADVPDVWFPQQKLDARSHAFGMVHGGNAVTSAQSISAEAWFDRYGSDRFNLLEQSVVVSNGDVLSLLNITEHRMMEAV